MQNEIQHRQGGEFNGLDAAGPSAVGSDLEPGCGAQRHRRRKVRVEVEVPEALMGSLI